MKSRHLWWTAMLIAAALVLLGISSCSKDKDRAPTAPRPSGPDADGDGVADASDHCPNLIGEQQYSGCPWYKVDVCSGAAGYTLTGQKWSTLTPGYSYSSSFPQAWRGYVDNAVSAWNGAGSRLQIRRLSTVSGGAAQDGRSVVSYARIEADILGRTYSWYDTRTNDLLEADIVLNSDEPLTVGGSPSSFDVSSILTHEFGHFVGLGHQNDRTQTMYPMMPPDCTIYRTLCAGDVAGIRRLYP